MSDLLLIIIVAVVVIAVAMMLRRRPSDVRSTSLREKTAEPVKRAREIDTGAEPVTEPVPPEPPHTLQQYRLLTDEDVTPEAHNRLMAEIRGFKRPPQALNSLLSPDTLSRASTEELAEMIRSEPALVARILSAVNSPLYGLQQQITSVQHGIAFLGINAIRDLALRYMLQDAIATSSPALAKLYERIWNTSILASEMCTLLLRQLNQPNSAEAATSTILSFLGDLPLLNLMGVDAALEAWNETLLERTRLLQDQLGVNSDIAGRLTMEQWELPQGIILGVDRIHRVPFLREAISNPGGVQAIAAYLSARLCEDLITGRAESADEELFDSDEYWAALHCLTPELQDGLTRALASADFKRLCERVRGQRRA